MKTEAMVVGNSGASSGQGSLVLQGRLAVLDIMKALCILLVVWGHLLETSFDHTFVWNLIYMCHMPCFFLISGYLMYGAMGRHGPGLLIKKRVSGLLTPFVIWSLLAVAANTVSGVMRGGSWLECLGESVMSSFLYANSVWFFLALFLTECWFIVLHEVHAFLSRRGIALKMWAVLLAGWVCAGLLSTELFKINKVAVYFPFFVMGYWLASRKSVDCCRGSILTVGKLASGFLICGLVYGVLVSAYSDNPVPFDTFTNWMYRPSLGSTMMLRAFALYGVALVGCAAIYFASRVIETTGASALCCSIGVQTAIIYPVHIMLTRAVLALVPTPETVLGASMLYLITSCMLVAAIMLGVRMLGVLRDALTTRTAR
ncbi:acyltransferase family protein [Olsenella sp. An270]|uniref:acyltransferase family protein n=1 Tax=Olsenella sp. An270 TaxID=1965615 RepID=UPI000B386371|nr:acyltransferase family protein [Olsenella sp. An270]OUO58208.1 hypothetical protein B5F73_09060 [Olsenella sp. An270]